LRCIGFVIPGLAERVHAKRGPMAGSGLDPESSHIDAFRVSGFRVRARPRAPRNDRMKIERRKSALFLPSLNYEKRFKRLQRPLRTAARFHQG
jgi:hypothetical protein